MNVVLPVAVCRLPLLGDCLLICFNNAYMHTYIGMRHAACGMWHTSCGKQKPKMRPIHMQAEGLLDFLTTAQSTRCQQPQST